MVEAFYGHRRRTGWRAGPIGDAMNDGPIENYLDNLFVELRRNDPRGARAMLNEAEAHLREAADEAARAGMSPEEAEAEAVRRFGEARLVAAADRRGPLWVARGTFISAWSLGAWGAVAVGVSGLVAGSMRLAGVTNKFLAGPWPTPGITGSDCARWLGNYPHAGSCAQAAMADWAFETVAYRVAFGVLGLAALACLWFARRRWLPAHRWAPLPATVVDTVATTIFGLSGAWLAGLGLDTWVVSAGHGSGQWLSAAPVALAAAAVFGTRLLRDLHAAR
jgi:hypothetical protein